MFLKLIFDVENNPFLSFSKGESPDRFSSNLATLELYLSAVKL